MSSNVGLTTPRGSGTSGYIQRNLSLLKPRSQTTAGFQPYNTTNPTRLPHTIKPCPQILAHDRLRQIEIEILSFRDDLEKNPDMSEEEVDEKCEEVRGKLTREMEAGGTDKKGKKGAMKRYQVHDLAEAKIKESERLRRALGLRGDEAPDINGGEGGGEHPMARQERRRRERDEERAREDLRREEGGEDEDEEDGRGGNKETRTERRNERRY